MYVFLFLFEFLFEIEPIYYSMPQILDILFFKLLVLDRCVFKVLLSQLVVYYLLKQLSNSRDYRNWSVPSSTIVPSLKISEIFANFQSSGKIAVRRDRLKILASGSAITVSLNSLILMPSIPGAFLGLIDLVPLSLPPL